MDLINPYHLPRPERATQERVFERDGPPFAVRLRDPDAADMNLASELAKRLITDYILGRPDEGILPALFFDGIKVSESLFFIAAAGQEMQPDPSARYNAETLIVLMDRRPNDGIELARWINQKLEAWKSYRGNSTGGPTATSSEASSETPTSTPSPSSAPTFSSSVSTLAWEPSADSSQPPIPVRT